MMGFGGGCDFDFTASIEGSMTLGFFQTQLRIEL